jgi:triosephosphate isomerase
MRRTVFVGNWKAHKTIPETEAYFKELIPLSATWKEEVIITPSFVNLDAARRCMPPNVKLGAQDASHVTSGAYCAEVTVAMLNAVGVKYAIVGHIERRAMGDDNLRINKKVMNCLNAGITPILCVGDTLIEYNNNQTREVIEKQIRECLEGVTDFSKIMVAYQPIWSIGTGFYAAGDLANIIADFIRKTVQKMTNNPMSANFPILYGGGITVNNAREYLEVPEIDGLMVGPTSLTPQSMHEIVTTKFKIKKYAES